MCPSLAKPFYPCVASTDCTDTYFVCQHLRHCCVLLLPPRIIRPPRCHHHLCNCFRCRQTRFYSHCRHRRHVCGSSAFPNVIMCNTLVRYAAQLVWSALQESDCTTAAASPPESGYFHQDSVSAAVASLLVRLLFMPVLQTERWHLPPRRFKLPD